MSSGRKLALMLAFSGLIALAFGASCDGFFVDPQLTGITVTPTNKTLSPGDTQQMTATGTFDGGRDRDVTASCTWESSNKSVATVGETTGKVVAATNVSNPPVTTTIKATDGRFDDSTTITVCPTATNPTIDVDQKNPAPNATVTFTAMADLGSGSQDVTSEVTWNISNTAVISSIANDGTATINASTSGQSTNVSWSLCGVTSSQITITVQ
jgi:uncharacterized protein YjdB